MPPLSQNNGSSQKIKSGDTPDCLTPGPWLPHEIPACAAEGLASLRWLPAQPHSAEQKPVHRRRLRPPVAADKGLLTHQPFAPVADLSQQYPIYSTWYGIRGLGG
jgi:hypothetical protein